jgi:hypothetical protein
MKAHLHLRIRTWRFLPSLAFVAGAAAPESPYVTCPECAKAGVKKLTRQDGIDRVSRAPWSTVQRFLGGRLYHCLHCRLQFYDCRKQAPGPEAAAEGS